MELGISNRRAMVIGAARGLGNAIALSLLNEGATVYAAVRNTDALQPVIEGLISEQQARLIPLKMDLTDLDSIQHAMARIEEEGGIDILVGNCGGPPPAAATETRRAQWLEHFESMAANIFHITQCCLPAMQKNQWGRIIYITSGGVEQPIPNLALSNGIRSAVVGWAKTLSNEVARDGITVNCVLPGRIHTHRIDELNQAAAIRKQTTVEEIVQASKATIPARRFGKPQEFADVVTFLASDRASYVTGSKIRIDGGAITSV